MDIIQMLDVDELGIFKEDVIVPLLKQPKVIIEQTILSCGPYPLSTWLNCTIYFVSQMDEIQKGTHIMDGKYECKQADSGETIKVFSS
jgi:hypothetical protein